MYKDIEYILENIRVTRIKKGITIDELSAISEVSRSNIYYIESKKKNPTLYTLFKLAKAMDVDIQDFFNKE